MVDTGASPEERLLFACRSDNLDLFHELLSSNQDSSGQLNVNTTDSWGMTPLHICILYQSTEVLPELLEEEVDVDLQEKSKGDTPLHVACRIEGEEDEEIRNWIVEQLLSAGADPKIRNNQNEKPEDLILGSARDTSKGQELRQLLREAEAQATFASKGDVVDEDEEGSEGTPSDDE